MNSHNQIIKLFRFSIVQMGIFFILGSVSLRVSIPYKMPTPNDQNLTTQKHLPNKKANLSKKVIKKDPIKAKTVEDILKANKIDDINILISKVLKIDKNLSKVIAQSIYKYTQGTNIEPELVVSIMTIESHGRPKVVSSAGARGLLQVMPFWKKVMKMENADLFDPDTNIKMGIEVLMHYIKRYKHIERALAAYNGSLGSRRYPRKVLKVYSKIMKSKGFKKDYNEKVVNVSL